jgi:hypothetical protein
MAACDFGREGSESQAKQKGKQRGVPALVIGHSSNRAQNNPNGILEPTPAISSFLEEFMLHASHSMLSTIPVRIREQALMARQAFLASCTTKPQHQIC